MPNPLDNEELYDSILLGNAKSPGRVKITNHTRKVNWDVKVAQGQNGATTTPKDVPPVTFMCRFHLVRDEVQGIDQIADWPAFLDVINSTLANPKTPKALDIYHPDLATQDITSVCKASVGGVEHDGMGGQYINVEFIEYRPAKSMSGSPSGSKTNANAKKTSAPDPDAAALAELAALTKKYNDTPWGSS